MKTTYRFIIAALAAAVALSSCTKDIAADREGTDPQDGVRTIAISFDTPTKTFLGGPDGLTPQFKEGDLVMVSDRIDHEVCTVHVVNKEAYFTTTLVGKELKAAYPAKYAKLDDGGENIVDVLVPTNQTGRFEDANIAMTDEFTGNKAKFTNKAAILRFYVDESIGVKAISISAGRGLIVGGEATDGQYISDGRFENGEWREVDSLSISGGRVVPKLAIDNRTRISVSIYDPMVDSTLADLTDDPDGRICYVAIRPVESCDLNFIGTTSTQEVQGRKVPISSKESSDTETSKDEKRRKLDEGPFLYAVDRIISGASISAGKMADVFLPYYIKINVGTEQEPVYQYWSYCNLGAFLPEEPGLYFSWGNVDGHWLNGKPDAYAFTPEVYADSPANELNVDITPFGPNDAASAAWNGALIGIGEVPFGWRMPTGGEFEALKSCKSEWKSSLKGRSFGSYPNFVFFPATGYSNHFQGIIARSNQGEYWSSTIVKGYEGNANFFLFDENSETYSIRVSSSGRYEGRVIRPVYEPESQGLDIKELEEGGNLF